MNSLPEIHSAGFGSLDIRSKLLLFILLMVLTLMFNHPAWHGIMTLGIVGAGLGMGLTFQRMFSRLIPLFPLFLLIAIFTGFSSTSGFIHPENRAPLLVVWKTLCLTRGGILLGITFLLRLVNMVVFTLLILASTPLDDFINLFVKLRFPPSLSFMITTALRFVPALDKKRALIITAQRARGIDPDQGGWLWRFKAHIAIMIPLIVNAILIADQLTMALMNRGFGYRNQWTILSRLCFTKKDYLILTVCAAGLASGIFIKFHGNWGMI
ncbi:energy-coupling factor transporter transmembrane component T family protein [Desulfospira joergensenii]|uniref:energy-coupling factor transporter transmembrane component T family protein n=1 Tax=Desulfospira joergensenii TaxID=53329 RepID=UPI0003B64E33|nr:energy-coupling factor transporter transmembrane component T [Desulfospira joergensenii]